MTSIDIKILKFLNKLKIDNDFHDVSVIFSFKEKPEDMTEFTDFNGNVMKVKNTYSKYTPTILKRIHSTIFNHLENKTIVDECVISIEEKGYVTKLVEGKMNIFALGPQDDLSYANNSICRITTKGIEYIENHTRFRRAYLISIVSLLISIIALLISVISKK